MNKSLISLTWLLLILLSAAACTSARTPSPTPSLIQIQEIPETFRGTWRLESMESEPLPGIYQKLIFNLNQLPTASALLTLEDNGKLREIGKVTIAHFSGNDLYLLFEGEIAMSISIRMHEVNGHIEGTFTHGLSGTDAYKGKVLFVPYTP